MSGIRIAILIFISALRLRAGLLAGYHAYFLRYGLILNTVGDLLKGGFIQPFVLEGGQEGREHLAQIRFKGPHIEVGSHFFFGETMCCSRRSPEASADEGRHGSIAVGQAGAHQRFRCSPGRAYCVAWPAGNRTDRGPFAQEAAPGCSTEKA